MLEETRACQNCKNSFTIFPDDFVFYEKIQVPPPTFCPQCRMIRRLVFRNERSLYQSICALCKKGIISAYAPENDFTVYCQECWWSDKWNPEAYGADYNWDGPFFTQFARLAKRVPRPNFFQRNTENSPYANIVGESRNIHLSYSITSSEEIIYSKAIDKSYHLSDCLQVTNSEWCHENVFGDKNSSSYYLYFSRGCVDSWFLYDCVNCQNCFLSTNLRNKNFVIRNKQFTKNEYLREIERMNLGSAVALDHFKTEFKETIAQRALHKYANNTKAQHSSGDNLTNTENVKNSFDCYDLENAAYSLRFFKSKDSYDAHYTLASELLYEYTNGGSNSYFVKFSMNGMENLSHLEYTDYCPGGSSLFGCIAMRKKSFCILNKQYTEIEYHEFVKKIKEQMMHKPYIDAHGRVYKYGEFFPMELSPFSYNETIAQEHFPLMRETAKQAGYRWREDQIRDYKITMPAGSIPDHIKDVSDTILEQTVGCAHTGTCHEQCTTAFKIMKQELDYYRRTKLPLPHLCPNCRHYGRIAIRNPLQLWRRTCACAGSVSDDGRFVNTVAHFHDADHCPRTFETSFSPDRQEIVYCEECYQSEIV